MMHVFKNYSQILLKTKVNFVVLVSIFLSSIVIEGVRTKLDYFFFLESILGRQKKQLKATKSN